MDTLIQVSSSLFILIGSFLLVSGGVGILRFPDFYTRMHAVGVTETAGTAMILIGLIIYNPDFMVDIKLVIILLMTLFISPTASHALAHAAMINDKLKVSDESKNSDKKNEKVSSSNS